MNKRHPPLKIRVEYEPNRFSSDYLVKVYEQLKPVDAHIISTQRKGNEESGNIAMIEGEKK